MKGNLHKSKMHEPFLEYNGMVFDSEIRIIDRDQIGSIVKFLHYKSEANI